MEDGGYTQEQLKAFSSAFTVQENRENVEISTVKCLLNEVKKDRNDLVLDGLRALRNVVANVPRNAEFVMEQLTEEEALQYLVTAFLKLDDLSCLRVLMQILANCLSQKVVLEDHRFDAVISCAICVCERTLDTKTLNFLSFALLSLMQKHPVKLQQFAIFIPFWAREEDCSEFKLLCLKHIIENCPLSEIENGRHGLYETVRDLELHSHFEEDNIATLVKDFTVLTDFVFQTQHGIDDDFRPLEIVTLLDIIISISKTDKKTCLQEKSTLLMNTLYLLRMLNDVGKQGNHPDLKPITKMAELSELKKSGVDAEKQLENNPTFGLKVKLIQLLVNLVWEHTDNQNLVAEHSGLQVVLDCSQVDARNPLITQWVVMSVRALCLGNDNNQAILASLRREGVADSALWKELGIKLDDQGDKIKVTKN